MANEMYSGSLLVEVAGSPLAVDMATRLTRAYVDDSRNLPDAFVLRFRDPDRAVLAKTGLAIGVEVKLSVRTSDPGGPERLMTGEVTALSHEIDRTGGITEVRGLDHAHRLFRGRRVAGYAEMDLATVVRRVTERAGLKVGTIDQVSGFGGRPHTQISQDNVSDWAFLSRLADQVGAEIAVIDGALNFVMPQAPSDAPSTKAKATADPLVLEANRNLVALRAGVTAAEQVPEVCVKGWDYQRKQAVNATAPPTMAGYEVSTVDPAALGKKFGAPPLACVGVPYREQPEAQTAAEALAAHVGGGCAEVEGVAKGNPKLRAGTAVALVNVGPPFEGRYTLTSTRHLFTDTDGYTTAFTISSRQERSFYGLASGGRRAGRGGGGLVPAIVSDVRDPAKLGRVRLTFPWLADDFTSGWARTVQPGAGKDRGALVLPEVGDEVLVGFEHGHFDAPYVLGGLHNGTDTPPKTPFELVDGNSGAIAGRVFVSRTGHRVELAETAGGADGIRLATGDAKYVLQLDKQGTQIVVRSDGTVTIKGSKGVTVDAGTGPLELSGKNVTIKSMTDVSVEAKTGLTLKANAEASLDAAKVTVNAKASAQLTSSGEAVVRGAIVRIN